MSLPLPSGLKKPENKIDPLVVPDNKMCDDEKKDELPKPLVVLQGYERPFIFLLTRSMEDEQLDLLKEYGKVIKYDPEVYKHIPIDTLDFHYFILDVREKEDRKFLEKIGQDRMESYNLVSFCHSFQKFDEFHEEVGVANIISKLPPKQAFKVDFDRLLLQKKITKPRLFLSCIKSVLRLSEGTWKKDY